MNTYSNDNHYCFAFVPTIAVIPFSLVKQAEKTVSFLAMGVQEASDNSIRAGFCLLPDGNHQKCERTIRESNELHIWWFVVPPDGIPSVGHRWPTSPDSTFKGETPVAHSSARHCWYTPA
ncbi:hypothetical protein AVEN_58963-1 [Araneus ventricosus]|uniref:Uncharacterized protein n=1 Tax=Araneus ventricosus TaxID=182803 RepID=A0A4Y2GUD4_ARAVE|nr:hypothetical protein AVEN_58963-1 [Araneus ventricosus]